MRAGLRQAIIDDLTENLISVIDDNLDNIILALNNEKLLSVGIQTMSKEQFEEQRAAALQAQEDAANAAAEEATKAALDAGFLAHQAEEEDLTEPDTKPLIEVVSH
jgi:hypothetical protein